MHDITLTVGGGLGFALANVVKRPPRKPVRFDGGTCLATGSCVLFCAADESSSVSDSSSTYIMRGFRFQSGFVSAELGSFLGGGESSIPGVASWLTEAA